MTTITRDLELVMPPPPSSPDPVEQARSEVEKLYAMEAAHADRGAQARKDEQDLSSSAGVLDLASFESASTVDLARRLSEIHSIALLADRAVELCRQKRREGIVVFYQAQAAQARERAAQAQAQADRHAIALRTALTKVEALEGCSYVPVSAPASGGGVYADPGMLPMARSAQLALEVQGFEHQARAADRQQVTEHGTIEAEATEDALFAALAGYGPFQIVPTRAQVRAWLPSVQARGVQRVVMVWRGGAIDAGASRGWRADDD